MSPIVQKVKIFDLLVFLLLKFHISENICDDYHISVLCSLDMQFNKHAVVLLHGQEGWGMPFTHFFLQKNAFPTTF